MMIYLLRMLLFSIATSFFRASPGSLNQIFSAAIAPCSAQLHLRKGSNFSAGTVQLICIARILMAHQRIVFLDECTANVDMNTDSEVQKAFSVLSTWDGNAMDLSEIDQSKHATNWPFELEK